VDHVFIEGNSLYRMRCAGFAGEPDAVTIRRVGTLPVAIPIQLKKPAFAV
jgi:hypothetical protein